MNSSASFTIDAMELGPMENFIYLIQDSSTGRLAVVDPAWEVDQIIRAVEKKGVVITDILLTHSHADHVNGVQGILNKYDAQVHLLKEEARFWGKFDDSPTTHYGGDVIKLGDTEIKILHTPGHTPGSACYHVGDNVIAGDTLFVFGCGRCDLSGGDANQMFVSLKKLRTDLPLQTKLYPGHNYADKETSTIEEQIEGNPFLHFHTAEEFVHYRMVEHDKIRDTPYHAVSK